MNTTHWIICERSTRWAAALRIAFSHQAGRPAQSIRLHEVRSLSQLTDRLNTHADSLVLIEVTPENLEAALAWLAAATSREKHLTAVALLGYRSTDHRDIVATALREAGVRDVIDSPRQIRPILALGDSHASKCNVAASCPAADQTFENWAWSLLPWQDAPIPPD